MKKTMTLENIILNYSKHKEELEVVKKVVDRENKEIKSQMKALGQTEIYAGEYKAKYYIQKRESMDEDMLINMFSQLNDKDPSLGIIKTKEYIDFDALENAIYNGKIPQKMLAEMGKARSTKEVEMLKITKEE